DLIVTGVQTCALPILDRRYSRRKPLCGSFATPSAKEGNVSERESSNDLAGSRLCTTVERSAWRIAAVDPIDIAVSGCQASVLVRSEERRVGKECSGGW